VPSVAEAAQPETTPPDNPLADELVVSYGERRYRVRGLAKNLSYETLKINLHIAQGEAYYVDTFDLYSARARHLYIGTPRRTWVCARRSSRPISAGLLLRLEALQHPGSRQR